MKFIERSTDNKYCRELTIETNKTYSLIYIKETKKVECFVEHCDKFPKNYVLPTVPIQDLLWLMNGDTK